jgi:hypothetical protein
MKPFRMFFVALCAAAAVPALAEDLPRLPGGFSLGGAAMSSQWSLLSLNGGATTVHFGAGTGGQESSSAGGPQFTLRIDHALSESVLIGGTASSQRLNVTPDGSAAQTHYLVGARIGIRF